MHSTRTNCVRVGPAIFAILLLWILPCRGVVRRCKIKVHSTDSDLDIEDLMLSSSVEEDYYTENDIISKSTNTTTNVSVDYPTAEEGPFLEGDIIPSASNVQFTDLGAKWPNATVPFLFHNMMSYDGRLQVLKAMNEYHRHTCIQFQKREAERDYLVIGSSYQYVCASSVGRQGGAQLLHLGPACTRNIGTPMHELMHALGFYHEHMRPDRDRYVYINYSNIDEILWKNFLEVNPGIGVHELGAGYDFGSLMHYRLCAMTNNTWPTIVPKVVTHAKIGQRIGFSRKDIIKLNHFYNCSNISRTPKLFKVGHHGTDNNSGTGSTYKQSHRSSSVKATYYTVIYFTIIFLHIKLTLYHY
ncbi:zinc metalloproteinase nas-4-like isoform X2 [Homalodisca vitripennis]|uniref:zinc metalloproteinase nas-4-like isoform X2 n=1 Tax=Homalodisca vitripennis TaxID=197043 RepID=UPI001EEB8C69|nr:zinc metalloproteinase nas-4-like isoform X2 [Homalodisca vitripennis]